MEERYKLSFSGVITAIVTPFKDDGALDIAAIKTLTQKQVKAGVHAIVICGSTGEAMSLSDEEFQQTIESYINACNEECKLQKQSTKTIVGLSSNNLQTCIKRARLAEQTGADAILAVAPYYSKPTQEGIEEFFTQISQATKLPIILYNVPSRTASDIKSQTAAKLARLPNIVGIKDATGDLSRIYELKEELLQAGINPSKFAILSGEDKTFADFCTLGGCGVISVISNMFPTEVVEIYNACKSGNQELARQKQASLYQVINATFSVSNPIGIKHGLKHLGMCSGKVRLPLTPMASKEESALKLAINNLQNKS